ncbi:MAG: glycosyltransferase family 39 protein, partial [Planctomycetaceae bacterium]|nr:glycosyltransferase family 39 protein [Planctomycetaceae bacterium]
DIWGAAFDDFNELLPAGRSAKEGWNPHSRTGVPRPIPSGVEFLSQRLPFLRHAMWILASIGGLGLLGSRRLLKGVAVSRLERAVIIFACGVAAQSVITLGAGASGHLSRAWILGPGFAALLLNALCGGMEMIKRSYLGLPLKTKPEKSGLPGKPIPDDHLPRWFQIVCGLVILGSVAWLVLGSMSPSSDFDVREYHLQGPKEWFESGRITFLRHNVYTSFPFLTEMLSLSGMVVAGDWWDGALTGKLILSCFQVMTAVAIFAIGRRLFGFNTGLLACLILVTTPWTLRISLIAYAEGGLTFFQTAVVLLAVMLLHGSLSAESRRRLILTMGLMAGGAMACKYTGLVSAVLPAFALTVLSVLRSGFAGQETSTDAVSEGSTSPRIRSLPSAILLFAIGVLAVVFPWLIRNFTDTGNPVYPLADSVFHSPEWSAEMNARWKPVHSADEHRLSSLPRHFRDVAIQNDWTNGLFFAFAIPVFGLRICDRRLWIPAAFVGWTFLTWWALTHRIDRFWIPVIPVLSLSAATALLMSRSGWWRSLVLACVVVSTFFHCYENSTYIVGYHAGLQDLTKARQAVIPSHLQHLNRTLADDSVVLMVGEAQVFDATFAHYYHTVFDDCLLEEWITSPDDRDRPVRERRMRSPEEVRQILEDHGVTHVVVNWNEILRYRQTYGYTDFVQPIRFADLVDAGILNPPHALFNVRLNDLSAADRAQVLSWDAVAWLAQVKPGEPPSGDPLPDTAVLSMIQVYSVRTNNGDAYRREEMFGGETHE